MVLCPEHLGRGASAVSEAVSQVRLVQIVTLCAIAEAILLRVCLCGVIQHAETTRTVCWAAPCWAAQGALLVKEGAVLTR